MSSYDRSSYDPRRTAEQAIAILSPDTVTGVYIHPCDCECEFEVPTSPYEWDAEKQLAVRVDYTIRSVSGSRETYLWAFPGARARLVEWLEWQP